MLELDGKTAFITGGASGIGLAIAEAFGREGMKVMLADVETAALAKAVTSLQKRGVDVAGVATDVAVRESVRNAARVTLDRFGKVHIVCNNAGIVVGGCLGEVPERDWDWIIDVNLKGVVNGMEVFVPLIDAGDEGGHFVNTASVNGMFNTQGLEAYSATKFAVVAMSEGWAKQLAPRGIGLSILCPGMVESRIVESRRNRNDRYGEGVNNETAMRRAADSAMAGTISTGPVAGRVVEAIRANELYVFTHTEYRTVIKARFDAIVAAFDKSESSPALAELGDRKQFVSQIPK